MKYSLKHRSEEDCRKMVGKKVVKMSGKPFKSGNKINTIKAVEKGKHTGLICFLFVEDESEVECRRCAEVE